MEPDILSAIEPRELGQHLVHARKRAGLTQADAAETLGVARTTITAIEAGERRIRHSELIKLASAYGRPFSEFIRPRPIVQPLQPQLRPSMKRKSESIGELSESIDEIESSCRDYADLFRIHGLKPVRRYPAEYQSTGVSLASVAESIATMERNRLGLGDGPVARLRDVIEMEAGVPVFYMSLPAWCCGLYFYEPEIGPGIVVNPEHPVERQRTTMSHEYAHFLTNRHSGDVCYGDSQSRFSSEEKLANEFMMYFLLPPVGVRRRFNQLLQTTGGAKAKDLIDLAVYFGVAVEALVRWLEDLRLLPTGTYEAAKERGFPVRKLQAEAGVEMPLERTEKFPLEYQRLAFNALQAGKITEGRFAQFMHVDHLEARRIARALQHESDSEHNEAREAMIA